MKTNLPFLPDLVGSTPKRVFYDKPRCQHGFFPDKWNQCKKEAVTLELRDDLCEEHYAEWYAEWGEVTREWRVREALPDADFEYKNNLEQKRCDEYNEC